jgi:tetratricopeptide (TPR) repeat protein
VVGVDSPAELELAVYQALVELGPAPDAPARLAAAQALLASMPIDTLQERAPLPAGSRMPLAANPLFVGRGDELLQVARALRGGGTTVALGQVVASTGLGGLGKTQLAVELVHRYGRYFAGGVYWLSFANADEIPLQVAACAGPRAMSLGPGIEDLSLEERVQRVQRAWQSTVPRLLVFDNCEEESLLEAWRPTSGACRVLVTSRRSHWSPTLGITSLPLDLLPRPDSIELLRRYRPDLASGDPGLDAIARELGDLPLAVHLAGSYLRAYQAEVSLDSYLAELCLPAVFQHASLLGEGLDDTPSPTHHVQSLAQTFALCLGRLDGQREADGVAIALLARIACMAPGEPVPVDLFAKTLEDVDPLRRADALRRLGAIGLMEAGEGWLRLHRLLVHFVRQLVLDAGSQAAVDRMLIDCGRAATAGNLAGPSLIAIIPHLLDVASRDTGDRARQADLYYAAGRVLYEAGDLFAARPWYERALARYASVSGQDHAHAGDLTAARRPLERALTVQALRHDHPLTAWSLYDLALLHRVQGDPAAARPLFERALAIRERVLGPDHPDTVATRRALAELAAEGGGPGARGG